MKMSDALAKRLQMIADLLSSTEDSMQEGKFLDAMETLQAAIGNLDELSIWEKGAL